jgi:hypothetical protein
LNYYGQNSARETRKSKAKAVAIAAFLGDLGWIHRRVTECGSEVTFFLGLAAFFFSIWHSRGGHVDKREAYPLLAYSAVTPLPAPLFLAQTEQQPCLKDAEHDHAQRFKKERK